MGKKNAGLLYDTYAVALAHPSTKYVEIPVMEGTCGLQVSWLDATSSATITLESTDWPRDQVAADSTNADEWSLESETITGPTGAGRGSSMKHLGNVGADRLRIKIVTAAACKLRIRANWKVN